MDSKSAVALYKNGKEYILIEDKTKISLELENGAILEGKLIYVDMFELQEIQLEKENGELTEHFCVDRIVEIHKIETY